MLDSHSLPSQDRTTGPRSLEGDRGRLLTQSVGYGCRRNPRSFGGKGRGAARGSIVPALPIEGRRRTLGAPWRHD